MLRSAIKSAFAAAMSWAPPAREPFVVFYHRVVERLDASGGLALPAMEITVAMLERHLDWLGRHFRIVPLSDLGSAVKGSKPAAAITFDDGYSDVFRHAFPLLMRKGMPAAVFVVTDLIGTSQLPLHERLHALLVQARRKSPSTVRDPFATTRSLLSTLPSTAVQGVIDSLQLRYDINGPWQDELEPLTWEQLGKLRDAGITIASHSKSHPFLCNEDERVAIDETAQSRRVLKEKLGVDADCFAYPGGSFDTSVVDAVAAAGYRYAFTTCRHRDARHPLLTIPRTGLWQQSCLDPFGRFSPSVMSCQAAGAFRWASPCTQRHDVAAAS